MKKIRVYLIGLLLLPFVAVGVLFCIPGPDGNPLMNMEKLKRSLGSVDLDCSLLEDARRSYYKIRDKVKAVNVKDVLPEASKDDRKNDAPLETVPETLYKWRDENGNWHFSNQLPPDSVEFDSEMQMTR